MKVFVSFQPCDKYGQDYYVASWQTCVIHLDGTMFYNSWAKPTARQIRRWKKKAKPVPVPSPDFSGCSCFECMNSRGLA